MFSIDVFVFLTFVIERNLNIYVCRLLNFIHLAKLYESKFGIFGNCRIRELHESQKPS